MAKYTWNGGIDSNVLLEVVASRGSVTEELPNGLIIDRDDHGYGSFVDICADERFMVLLLVNGVNIARLFGHEVR